MESASASEAASNSLVEESEKAFASTVESDAMSRSQSTAASQASDEASASGKCIPEGK